MSSVVPKLLIQVIGVVFKNKYALRDIQWLKSCPDNEIGRSAWSSFGKPASKVPSFAKDGLAKLHRLGDAFSRVRYFFLIAVVHAEEESCGARSLCLSINRVSPGK